MRYPLVEATIRGEAQPEKFVLVHGHIDSWHVGIGDNATGNATLLEVARLLQAHQHHLKRTVRVCWWPGHSQGRYGGSTWYADRFALDLDANCVGHINCDSPGCRWATVYEDVMWMAEAEDVARAAIESATGQEARGIRPLRAGDISFNNIGISTFFMLSSTMSRDLLEEKGYYAVGGCGGNIEWHTEEDTLQIADKEILLKDIRVYASAVLRLANSPLVPLDYRKTMDDLVGHLRNYQESGAERVSFEIALNAAREARSELGALMGVAEKLAGPYDVRDERVALINDALMRIGRHLVSVGFSGRGKFRQESALNVPPIPSVAPAARLPSLDEKSHLDRVTRTHVTRGVNAVAWSFKEAAREARAALESLNRL
jgi:N-acetylated-alpha-linked acidic dipeptidase